MVQSVPVGVLRDVDGEVEDEQRHDVRVGQHLPDRPLDDPEEIEGISLSRLSLHHDGPALELVEGDGEVHVYLPVSGDVDGAQADVCSVVDQVAHHSHPVVAFIR